MVKVHHKSVLHMIKVHHKSVLHMVHHKSVLHIWLKCITNLPYT